MEDIKNLTGIPVAELIRAGEDRDRRQKIIRKSTVAPQRLQGLKDNGLIESVKSISINQSHGKTIRYYYYFNV